jgi:hypothetical protein
VVYSPDCIVRCILDFFRGDYTFVFRQNEGKLIGTIKSPDVFDYTGELVSDGEIRFKREAGTASPAVEFVATRVGKP